MAEDIKSPQFPESIFEGTLSTWLKKEGDTFEQDDVLAEIETDKVVIEVTAQSDGQLEKIIIPEGSVIKSQETIGNYSKKITKKDKVLCAKYRKGHFEGVLDVMGRLTNLVNPKKIFMGKKDYQQYFLIKN